MRCRASGAYDCDGHPGCGVIEAPPGSNQAHASPGTSVTRPRHVPARCCTSSRAACRGRSTRALGRRTRVRGARQSCPTTRRAARRSRCSAPPLRRARRSRSATLRRQAPLAALSSHALPSPLAHSPLSSRFPDRPLRRGGVANPSKDAAHGRRDAARLARRNLPRPTPQRVRHGRGRPAVSFPHVESRTRCVSDINAFNCGARAHNRALHQELLYSLCATASSSLERSYENSKGVTVRNKRKTCGVALSTLGGQGARLFFVSRLPVSGGVAVPMSCRTAHRAHTHTRTLDVPMTTRASAFSPMASRFRRKGLITTTSAPQIAHFVPAHADGMHDAACTAGGPLRRPTQAPRRGRTAPRARCSCRTTRSLALCRRAQLVGGKLEGNVAFVNLGLRARARAQQVGRHGAHWGTVHGHRDRLASVSRLDRVLL